MSGQTLRFKRRPQVGYGWHSRLMARAVGGEMLYRTPDGRTVCVTMVDTCRGGRRLARWRDLRYVGRVLMDWCRKAPAEKS